MDIFQPADRLYASLNGVFPECDFRYVPETSSTNTLLREMCNRGELTRTTVLYTDLQSAGRGTRGRVWYQPSAQLQRLGLDLAISVAAPQLGLRLRSQRLSLAIGALVALIVERVQYSMDQHPGGSAPIVWQFTGVKWPNDLLIETQQGWRKAGGVLIETTPPPGSGPRWVVIGIGINVNSLASHFPPDLAEQVGTLREWRAWRTGLPVADAFIERDSLLYQLAAELARFVQGGGLSDGELLRAWQMRDRTLGVRYALNRDGQERQVTAAGIDPACGGLWVHDDNGQRWLVTSYTELVPA